MDEGGGGEVSREEVAKVVRHVDITMGLGNAVLSDVADGVAQIRRDATEMEQVSRRLQLLTKKSAIEDYMHDRGVKGFEVSTTITPSGKAIDQKLNPELFVLTRLINNRDYLNRIKQKPGQSRDEAVAEAVHEMIAEVRSRDKRAATTKGDLTVGLESEVDNADGRIPNWKVRRNLELTEKFGGVPVTYDAIRELPLPYSDNTRDQLRAMHELYKMKIIPPEHVVLLHVNLGGVDWEQGMDDVMEAVQILNAGGNLSAAGVVENMGDKLDNPNTVLSSQGWGRKPLFQGDATGPMGLPMVFKDNRVFEFRAVGEIKDFNTLVRNLVTAERMFEAVAAKIRLKTGESKDEDRDRKLAQAWEEAKLRNREIMEQYNFGDKATGLYADLARQGKSCPNLETRYGNLMWENVRRSTTDLRARKVGHGENVGFLSAYEKLCLEVRRKVNKVW